MRIGLDYDGTFTEDPLLWAKFIWIAAARGHEVVCVTMRRPDEPVNIPCDRVIYTSRAAKAPFCQAKGVEIDIWIDDSPHWLLNDSAG